MAFSKRGKRVQAMKKRGELPADATLPLKIHEWTLHKRRTKLKLERIKMMKELSEL